MVKKNQKRKTAFTLAEVVITLVVIGVVAAITVPMMNNSVSDKKWNVARQKARATIGEAFRLMTVNGEITTKKADGTDMTTADFVNTVIPRYLKLEKTCAPADYKDCGFPSTVKTPKGVTVGVAPNNYKWSELSPARIWNYSPTQQDDPTISKYTTTFTGKYGTTYDTGYFFRTLDGFSVAFLYNPYCVSDTKEHYTNYTTLFGNTYYQQQSMDVVCLMGIYDMNGKSGPNKVGMDIGFVGSFYNGFETTSAAVLPHNEEKMYNKVPSVPNWGGKVDKWGALVNYCNNLGKDNEWIMPDIDEMTLLYVGKRFITNSKNDEDKWFITRSSLAGSPGHNWFRAVGFWSRYDGCRLILERNTTGISAGPYVRCVRNTSLK